MPLSRASGLMNDETEIDGWSISRWPTPGSMRDDLDAEIAQMARPARSPARSRCAGEWIAPDETMTSFAAELRLAAVDQRLDADAARALEQQLGDLGLGRDRQVVAQPRAVIEIADRRRHPPVVEVGDRDREIAVR